MSYNTSSTTGHVDPTPGSCKERMEAFDALPVLVRRALDMSPFHISPRAALMLIQGGMTAWDVVARIREVEIETHMMDTHALWGGGYHGDPYSKPLKPSKAQPPTKITPARLARMLRRRRR